MVAATSEHPADGGAHESGDARMPNHGLPSSTFPAASTRPTAGKYIDI